MSSHASDVTSSEQPFSAGQVGLAIYALITTSVVLAGADRYRPFEIAALMLAQALSLMLAHGYAESVAHRTSLWSGLKHSFPILVVAAPSALVGLVFGVLELDGETVVYVGEALNLAALVALQGYATRRVGFTWAGLIGAVLIDLVAILTVVAIVALLK